MRERFGRWPAVVLLAAGVGAGLVSGVVARAWMRVISTDPEFSWSGTMYIVIAFGLFGAASGVALLARRWRPGLGRVLGRIVGVVGVLPVFMGAGAMLFPTVLVGGMAVGQRTWPRWVRVVCGALAAAPIVAIWGGIVNDLGAVSVRSTVGIAGLAVVAGALVLGASCSFGHEADEPSLPRPVRIGGLAAMLAVLLFVTVGVAGLRG
jgi:hypothetical protein